ncbi:MAG: PAS domain-containing sensor histidine kinase [Oscillibacter sp.]|nr:PAS domain-containing sensor histidine kinase [Oscillibacter sp.]
MTFRKPWVSPLFPFSWRDLALTGGIFACAVALCFFLQDAGVIEGFAPPVFVLVVLLVSRLTTGYLFGLLAAVLGMVCVNFVFTYPYWAFNLSLSGYPLTFFTLLMVSLITCTLTAQAKRQATLAAENEREKMRANLLRSVSHDIRTPLTSIVGSTSAVLENPGLSEAEQRELLENAREEAQWLIRVVENLLSITRMGDERVPIAKEPEPAEEILGAAAQKFRRLFPHVTVTVSAPEALLMVPMDPILIEQVLANLLENAAVHGGADRVSLFLKEEEGFARFLVRDNGRGIPRRELDGLFDGRPRPQRPPDGDGKRNMGLGLSVCRAIVLAHGGTIEARNLSQGAELSFRLPTTAAEVLT